MLNGIVLHSARGRLVPCSRLEFDLPRRTLVAGLQKAACLVSEASINHWSELRAGYFLCETDCWSNPVGQVLNTYIYNGSNNKNACISVGLRCVVVTCLGKSHGAADLLINTRMDKNCSSSQEAEFICQTRI